jgi:hypothetical protein
LEEVTHCVYLLPCVPEPQTDWGTSDGYQFRLPAQVANNALAEAASAANKARSGCVFK